MSTNIPSSDRTNQILYIIEQYGATTADIVSFKLGISREAVTKHLRRMTDEKTIKKIKLPKFSKRFLNEPYKSFIKKSIFYTDIKELEKWFKRNTTKSNHRDRVYFFNKLRKFGIIDDLVKEDGPVINKIMDILKEHYPDYIEFNKLASDLGMLPDDLTAFFNDNKDVFMDVEIKTSWDGKKLVRLKI